MKFSRLGAAVLAGSVLLCTSAGTVSAAEQNPLAEAGERAEISHVQAGAVVTVSGTIPSVKPDEAVSLTVLAKGSKPEESSPADVVYAAQKSVQNGVFSFDLDLSSSNTQEFTAWLMLEYSTAPVSYDFVYKNTRDVSQALDGINRAANAGEVGRALEQQFNGNTGAFILGVDEKLLEQLNPPYTNIYQAVLEGKPYTVDDFGRLSTIYSNAVKVEQMSQSSSADEIRSELESNGISLGVIEENGVYEAIRQKRVSKQELIYSRLASLTFESVSALKRAYEESVFLASVAAPVNGRFDLQYILENCGNDLGLSGSVSRLKTLGESIQIKIYQALTGSSFDTVKAFQAKLDSLIDANKTESGKGSGSGNGGGGSRPGGVSGDVTIYGPDEGETVQPIQPQDEPVFIDMAGAEWALEAVTALYEKGIVSGREEHLFAPDETVTREEFVKMAVLAAGVVQSGAAEFADVDSGEWYYPYIQSAVAAGIVKGVGDGLFGTGQNITRQDMAVMTCQAAKAAGLNMPSGGTVNFSDQAEIAVYAAPAVAALVSQGIISGNPDGTFRPEGTATRAEAAKLLYGILKLKEGAGV